MLKTKKIKKVAACALFFLFALAPSVYGQTVSGETGATIYGQSDAFRGEAGFEETIDDIGVTQIIVDVIQAFLGLLGIIFVILIIVGGYHWMTAGGNEEKVARARETISRAVIGLVIIVSAYAITYFVFSNLSLG